MHAPKVACCSPATVDGSNIVTADVVDDVEAYDEADIEEWDEEEEFDENASVPAVGTVVTIGMLSAT
jgi:hypothetical protein